MENIENSASHVIQDSGPEESSCLKETPLSMTLDISGAGIDEHRVPLGPETYHSERWAKILGYTKEELPPYGTFMDWLVGLIHPEDISGLNKAYDDFIEGRTPTYHIEIRMKHKSGKWIHVKGMSHATDRDSQRWAKHIIGLMLDISKRKKAEERQKLAISILERLNKWVDDADIIRDILSLIKTFTGLEAVAIRLNEGEDFPYYETRGFPAEFVELETSLCVYDAVGGLIKDESGHSSLECMCGNIIRGKTDPSLDFYTEGGSFWSNCTTDLLASTSEEDLQGLTRNRCNASGYESVALIPLRSGNETIGLLQFNDSRKNLFTLDMIEFFEGIGASIGIGIARHKDLLEMSRINKQLQKEINHRRKTENSLKKANEKLKKLDKTKSDFLSMVSHELRTPIAIIQEGVSLCLDGLAGEITKVQREILTDTLTNITRLSRLVTDLLDLSKIEAGKIKLRRNPMNLSEIIKKIIKSYDHQVQSKGIQLKSNLPKNSLMMYVDADKITQIFNNLINNAIRFTKTGECIIIKIEDKEEMVECSVSDTGIGIAEEDLPKLFTKFEQIGRAEGDDYKGTGLGLCIVKGLVEKHWGKIWIDSQLGKGTTVWFTLEKVPFPTVLIVDDDKKFTEIIKVFLSKEEYLIKEAYDGNEAIQKIKKEKPDLIILDMMLPGMSGYEVIGRLKQGSRTHDIPIIIISGSHVDETRLERVSDRSVTPVFSKPIDLEELKMKVTNLLMN